MLIIKTENQLFSKKNSYRLIRVAIFVGKNKGGDIMNNYFKSTLKNLSQGARLEYVRKHRYMSKDDVADYFDLGGKEQHKIFNSYEKKRL